MKKYGRYILIALIVLALALCGLVLCQGFGGGALVTEIDGDGAATLNQGWSAVSGDTSVPIASLPDRQEFVDNKVVLERTLPDEIEAETYLAFQNRNCQVAVYVNGSSVYSFGHETKSVFGNMYGSSMCLVAMDPSYAGATATIEFVDPYQDGGTLNISNIYIGDTHEIFHTIVISNIGVIVFILATAIMAVIYLGFFLFHLYRRDFRRNLLYLYMALFLLTSGFWIFTDSLLVQTFTSNTILFGCIPCYIAFMSLSLPYMGIAKTICPNREKVFSLLQMVMLAHIIIVSGLFLLGVTDYSRTLWIVHGIYALSFVVVEWVSWKELGRARSPYAAYLFAANTVLIAATVLSLASFYFGSADPNRFYRYSILALSGLMVIMVVKKIRAAEEAQNRMNIYREIAYIDVMTGLKNRNAFIAETESLEKELHRHSRVTVLSLDINDLKYINDNFGHIRGDEAICAAADVILKVFAGEDRVYRMGGDEFTVIICDRVVDIERCRAKVAAECKVAKGKLGLNLSMAFGWMETEISPDRVPSIMELLDSSDKLMYKDKVLVKDLKRVAGI